MKVRKISLIIPTRNRIEVLMRTIESILSKDNIPDEIIIIDQSDKPISIDINSLKTYTTIRLIYQEVPSLTKARNRGISEAKNNILLFCDDDIILLNDCIERICFYMEDNVALIAGNDQLTKKQAGKFDIEELISSIFFKGKINSKKGYVCRRGCVGRYPRTDKTIETEWAMGYFFAIRKDVAVEANIMFDENLLTYAYAEDLDFSFRYYNEAKRRGYKTLLPIDVLLEHKVVSVGRIPGEKASYMYVIHRYYLSQKLFGRINILALFWSDIYEILRRIFHRGNPSFIIKAHIKAIRNIDALRAGKISSELYNLIT